MSAMTKFYSPRPLSEEELHRIAPSIFTVTGHPSRSERFQPIPTIAAIRELAKEGFLPYGASENRTWTPGKRPYVKHMLKFRQDAGTPMTRVGDSTLEVVLRNANDGSSGYHLDAGIFKLACLNGLVLKSSDFGTLNVRHTGNPLATIGKVVEGTHAIAQNANKALQAPLTWSRIFPNEDLVQAFASTAHLLRFGEGEKRIAPRQLLIPRRHADMGKDLWSIFNVVQENAIAGGISALRDAPGSRRHWNTRGVTAINSNVRLNQQLWALAEGVAREAA